MNKTKVWHLYKIEGPTGRRYVGCTVRKLKTRLQDHWYDALYSRRGSRLLHADMLKFGVAAFSIELLGTADDASSAHALEKQLILACCALAPAGYNLQLGGCHAPSTRQKMSKSAVGKHAGERSGMAKLTDAQVLWAVDEWVRGRSCRWLGQKLGVHPTTVYRAVNRTTWAHLGV